MIDKYALGAIEFELFPDGANAALDKDGRATVLVYLDWIEYEFENGSDWKSVSRNAETLPRLSVVEIHEKMCREILSEMDNSETIAFYLGDELNEDGSRSWSTYLRLPDHRRARIEFEPMTLMVSVDADEDGAPTRDALTRLRRVVAEARDRYDERVEEWYWSDPDIP